MKVISKAPISHGFPGSEKPRLIILDSTPSTNTWCIDNIASLVNGDIVSALRQTAGRGRFSRKWFSAPNESIAMSAVLDGSLFTNTACLGQAAAISVAKLLKRFELKPMLKWPNDVMLNGRKVSGILMESTGSGMIVLGIGININTPKADFRSNGLGRIATSVKEQTGQELDCTAILPVFIQILGKELQAFRRKGVAYITGAWSQMDFLKGSIIKVTQPGKTMSGKYAGLSKDGFLLIKTPAGTEEITSGDISVRINKKG